jgi:hypothetical protein
MAMSPWVREQEGRAGLLARRAACAGDRRFVPGGDSLRQCALLSSASLPVCSAARPQARCRPWRVAGRYCAARRGAAVPNGCRIARRRSAAARAGLPGRGAFAGAGVLPDAVAHYQVGAAPPGGAPLPTVARCRMALHRLAALRCRPCRVADRAVLPTVPCCRPCRVAGGARCRALLDAR